MFQISLQPDWQIDNGFSGAHPGFFLGGGALVSCSTSTPINHSLFFCRIPVVLENRRSSWGGGVHTPCTLPLDSPLLFKQANHSAYSKPYTQKKQKDFSTISETNLTKVLVQSVAQDVHWLIIGSTPKFRGNPPSAG